MEGAGVYRSCIKEDIHLKGRVVQANTDLLLSYVHWNEHFLLINLILLIDV